MAMGLRRPWIAFVVILSVFSIHCSRQADDELRVIDLSQVDLSRLAYSIEKTYLANTAFHKSPVDYNSDGVTEFADFHNPGTNDARIRASVVGRDLRNKAFFAKSSPGVVAVLNNAFDLNGDHKKEIFFNEWVNDTSYLHIVDWEKDKTLYRIPLATKPANISRDWDCGINVVGVMDVNADGALDIIVHMLTAQAYQPRGIGAYDLIHKKMLWYQPSGAAMINIFLHDLNGDGSREIICGSKAPDNGEDTLGKDFVINGTHDKENYFTVYDSLGNLLVQKAVGGSFCTFSPFLFDWKGDGQIDVMVLYQGNRLGESFFFAPWNTIQKDFKPKIAYPDNCPLAQTVVDCDRDGVDELILAWKSGLVEKRDAALNVVDRVLMPGLEIASMKNEDMNGDGQREILVFGAYQGQDIFCLLNRALNLMACEMDEAVHTMANIITTGPGDPPKLLARSDEAFWILTLRRHFYSFLPALQSWWKLVAGIVLGAVIMGFFVGSPIERRSRKTVLKMFNALFPGEDTAFMLLDGDGRVLMANAIMEVWLKKPAGDFLDQTYNVVFPATPLETLLSYVSLSYKDAPVPQSWEVAAQQINGGKHLLARLKQMSLGKKNRGWRLLIVQDVTELVHSKRTIAWAGMAQKLAHEIKTPLSTVMLSAQQLQMACEERPDTRGLEKYTNHIVDQVDRLHNLTDAFLKFARIEPPRMTPLSLNEVVHEVIEEARFSMGPGIHVETTFDVDLPDLQGDRNQLKIALGNVVHNAINAMRGEGKLIVRTRLVQHLYPVQFGQGDGQVLQVEIGDTGCGIPSEQMPRLFEPFFSKAPGGTGMGLVIVKKIIEDHSGNIEVQSEQGIGTSVLISLPINGHKESHA